jgi:fructose-specific phosphotransferase system IIA component
MKRKYFLIGLFLFTALIFATDTANNESVIHEMTIFIFQLGIIIFAAKISGILFEKMRLPGTLGEITAGMILGPYLLGSVSMSFLGFPDGIFPLQAGSIPVTKEIYGISVIASIMLLFISGLETDLKLLLRYIFSGGVVGLGGVIFSFIPGALVGMYFLDKPFMSPECLFLGIMSTATSVGITAMILSKNRYMDSPEGVTILSAAIIDDVLGIIVLAIAVGISAVLKGGGEIDWGEIGFVSAKAIGFWLGFTALGLIFSEKLSRFLKIFKEKSIYSIMAFGMALFFAGIFEKAGLAMIIGAYVMGLSLSKTDISYEIQESIHPLKEFFVPIFFTVMGMLVNLNTITPGVIVFGLVYSAVAVMGKVLGCGLPSLLTGFNKTGALRIGLGMVPRGEVGLIIAGIGISNGFISQDIYGVGIMMVLIGVVITPPLLTASLSIKKKGTSVELKEEENETFQFDFYSPEKNDFFINYIIEYFDREGFYITKMILDYEVYQVRKDQVFIKVSKFPTTISFTARKEDIHFVKTLVYESALKLQDNLEKINEKTNLLEIKDSLSSKTVLRSNFDISKIIDPECVVTDLRSKTKEGIIHELVDILFMKGKITDKQKIFDEVMAREKVISTGMKNGIAIPHARSEGVDHTQMAIGIKRSGIEFEALDGQPSNIIILLVSSTRKDDPHIRILAAISAFLHEKKDIEDLLSRKTQKDIWEFFRN